ncbi:calpain-like isoform X3 [Symsagittifera roscoffensis]
MARPFILKTGTPAGKPSGRFEDSNWTSMYRQSFKSHHKNRYEVDRPFAMTSRDPVRPIYLPPIQPYMATGYDSLAYQNQVPFYYATGTLGSQTDRPFYYATTYDPTYLTPRMEPKKDKFWSSTYKDSFRGYDDDDAMQPYLYYQPLRYDVPYYQYPEPPPPQRRILDGTENREFGGGGRGAETRDYMGGLEIVEEPPSQYTIPIAPQIVDPLSQPRLPMKLSQPLFFDGTFDPKSKSFLLLEKFNGGEIKWLRPNELSVTPSIYSKHFITSDFKQGFLKDTWLLMACAAISRYPNLLKVVLPPDQVLKGSAHSGKIVVNFYLFGSWKTISIDDRLPCYGNDLAYARCDNPDEFWVSLIEKAYAKVFGSYEALELGHQRDALTDLTGGICEFYNLGEIMSHRIDLEHALYMGSQCHAMMTCSRNPLDKNQEQEYRTGLISGHGYEVTGVFLVPWERGGEEMVIRIQSPWDYSKAWTGSWSDLDPRWRTFTSEFKDFVGFNAKPSGEFFISYQDFLKQFHHVSICHLETPLYPGQPRTNLGFFSSHHGEWTTDINAGGSPNYSTSYHTNPQFHITLDPAKVPDDLYRDDKVLLIVALMLPDNRGRNRPMPYVAFSIYEVKSDTIYLPLTREHLSVNLPIASSGKFQSKKEIVQRFRVPPGELVIIPSTYYPEKESAYLLRLFSNAKMTVQSFSAA